MDDTKRETSDQPDERDGLRKRGQLLLFISALIVFAAFIVRDELRERAKDLEGSIDSAETFFATRRDNTVMAEQLKSIEDSNSEVLLILYLTDALPEKAWLGIVSSTRHEVLGIHNYAGSLGSEVDNIHDLLSKLKADSDQAKRASDLSASISDLREKCDAFAKELDSVKFVAKAEKQQTEEWANFEQRVTSLKNEYLDLSDKIQKLSNEVVIRAKDEQKADELRYKSLTWTGIALFVVGWVVALIAKLHGLDVFGA